MNPAEYQQFLKRNTEYDVQLDNAVDAYARQAAKAHYGQKEPGDMGERVDSLERDRDFMKYQIMGLKNYWVKYWHEYWNHMVQGVEDQLGSEVMSNPKRNICINGGFWVWNGAVTLPLGWTNNGTATLTRGTGRNWGGAQATQGGNFCCTVDAAGGSAASISRTFNVKGGSTYRLAGWINPDASDDTGTVYLIDNGASVTTEKFAWSAAQIGYSGWWCFPRTNFDALVIETQPDATTVTVKLELDNGKKASYSDIQLVQGPNANPDLWQPAPEDVVLLSGLGTLPAGYGTSGQQLQTDGAGTTSWQTPASVPTLASGTYTPTLTNETNITASNPLLCQYLRVGSTVTVSGALSVDPTTTLLQTQLGISLPIASNFANPQNCGGTAFCPTIAAMGAAIYADGTNDRARMEWICSDVNNNNWSFHFTYQII